MTEQTSAGPQTHAKFDYTDSDVILRSSDDVLFRVHKTKLAAHSTFFGNMFECGTASADERTAGIEVSEPAATLAVLFLLCYPIADDDGLPGELDALPLELLIDVYEATHKYDMWVARELLAHRVAPRVSEDPFRLVWTGYILGNQPLLTAASLSSLGCDILGDASYRVKSGLAWTSLVEYHVAYKRLVTSTLHSMSCMLYNELDSNRLTDKYLCNHLGYGDRYCSTAKVYQEQWRDLRGRLSVQLSAEWPEAALQYFVDGCLNNASVPFCSGCANTWRKMREEATELRPSLTLRLEDVDRIIAALRSSPDSLVHK